MTAEKRTLITAPSLGDQAYRVVRDMITSGELAPGERVTERGLAGRLSVSPTPVREAISRLSHERLLVRVDGRTLQVVAPSLRRLREMSLIQAALTGVAARLAAEYASREELDEIARVHRATVAEGAPREAGAAKSAAEMRHGFHELIVRAARNPSLADMIATADAFGRPLRLGAQRAEGASAHILHAVDEHEEIATAIQARDGALAERLMRDHTLWVSERYLEFAQGLALFAADELT